MSDRWRRLLQWPGRLGSALLEPVRRLGPTFPVTRGRVLRVVVVLLLAAAGYFVFVRQSTVDRHLLARLVLTRTALSGVPAKAGLSESVLPSQSTFAVTRRAAKRHPSSTAMYAREWYVSSSGPPEAGIVLQLLPDDATASRLVAEEIAQLKRAPSFTEETPTQPETFSVAGVAGARGVSYTLDDATTSAHAPVGTSYTVDYRVGRVAVSELMVSTSTTRDDAAIDKDARAGARLLAANEPGFSLMRTSWPLLASLIYAGATVVVGAGAFFGPELLAERSRRRRQHRHERELRRAREQYLARGRRTVRRQRAPAWSQPRRR